MTIDGYKFSTTTCWNEKYQPPTIDRTKDRYQGRFRLGLNTMFTPDSSSF